MKFWREENLAKLVVFALPTTGKLNSYHILKLSPTAKIFVDRKIKFPPNLNFFVNHQIIKPQNSTFAHQTYFKIACCPFRMFVHNLCLINILII